MRREVVSRNRTSWDPVISAAICCLFVLAGLGAFCLAGEPPARDSVELLGPELFSPPPIDSTNVLVFAPADKADEETAKADEANAKADDRAKSISPSRPKSEVLLRLSPELVALRDPVGHTKADEQDSQADDKAEPISPSRPEAEVLPELSPEMVALRDRVRQTLAAGFNQPPGTRENTPTEIIHHCLVFGCDATVRNGADGNRPANAIGCLAWNFSCGGYQLMRNDGRRMIARVGFGLQQRPGQFLAVLAQSGVPDDYEIRVGEHHGTVSDLVEYEKLDCRGGMDLSAKLIGLAFYVETNQTWKNQLGETWSIERIVEEELDRKVAGGKPELTDQLLGLSYALRWRLLRKLPLEGQFVRAKNYVEASRKHVLGLQNPDGSWHPRGFIFKGTSNDRAGLMRSNGRILEWLALSFPKDRLEDPQVVSSVAYLTGLLNSRNSRHRSTSLTIAESVDRMHALRALVIYDQRYFRPRDRQEPVSEVEAKKSVTRR